MPERSRRTASRRAGRRRTTRSRAASDFTAPADGHPDNVFGALAEPVMGNPWNLFLFLAVLASSTASLITTFLPTSRTMLGMATYKALPARFATIHPRYSDAVVRDGGCRG